MAIIRDGLLALATVGPAYGLQLRNELSHRIGRNLNGGQVYATLERLMRDKLIHEIDRTHDGLSLLTATPLGHETARKWLTLPESDWNEMVAKILLSLSLPGHSTAELISACRAHWQNRAQSENSSKRAGESLYAQAEMIHSQAALAWLDEAALAHDDGYAFSPVRPPKGRRPRNK